MNILADRVWNIAGRACIVDATDQTGTLVHTRVTGVAVVDDLLKGRDVPSADEVGV